MTSVYRTMGNSAFELYIFNHKTLSATDFILESDEVRFDDPKQEAGVIKAFGDNPKLNPQFNVFYQEAKKEYEGKFDGDAHLYLQSAALYATIMANRKLFPPDAITFTLTMAPDAVRSVRIPSTLEMAGKLFKQDHEKYLANFEKMLAETKKRKEAESAVPDESAKKASDTLMAIIVEQQKAEDQPEGDPLKVLLKDVMDDGKSKPDAAGTQTTDVTMADKASAHAVAKVLAKGGSVSVETVKEAYAEH